MHYRDDQHIVAFDCVENGVRKHASQAPSDVFIDDSPALGRVEDSLNGVFNTFNKRERNTWVSFRIPTGGLEVFF